MSQQKKRQHSVLSQTVEPTRLLSPVAVNRTAASGQHSTQSPKTADIPTSTTMPKPTLSSPTLSAGENERIAAGLLETVLPSLLAAGLIKRVTVTGSNLILLGFDPSLWSEDFRLV